MAITSLDKMLVYHRTDDRELFELVAPTTVHAAGTSTTTVAAAAFGFTFVFDGAQFSSCGLSVHGYLRLAGTIASNSNANLFAGSTNVILAPWWDTLRTAPGVGYVQHETQGTAPRRRFVAEWYVALNTSTSTTDFRWGRFQVVLYETTNRVEYRFGDLEVGGSPAATGSASIGCKGATNVVADNFRDFVVDDLPFGASKTTTTTTLAAQVFWPTWRYVMEPAYPMLGRYYDVSTSDITGLQDPEGELLWLMCANINWLICAFAPALVDISPFQTTAHTNPIFVAPVDPSADGLQYRVWVETYSPTGGTLSCDIGRDAAADPQPGTGADWTSLVTLTESSTPTGYRSWTSVLVTIPSSTTVMRFAFTGTVQVHSILVAVEPLTDIDPAAVRPSGVIPMCVGQLRQQGAAVHSELINRGWRTIARLATDRRQVVFSYATPSITDYLLAASTASRPIRVAAFSPASIKGWRGQSARAQVYARDTSDGGVAVLQERGGNAVNFTVDANGGEFRFAWQTMDLISEEPSIIYSLDPMGSMHTMFAGITWAPPFDDDDLIADMVAIPRLEYLVTLNARIRQCLRAWAIPGLSTLLERSGFRWATSFIVPPGVKALKAKIARSGGSTGSASDTEILAQTSGSSAADTIVVGHGLAEGKDVFPPDFGALQVVSTGETFQPTPVAAGDRLLESPTMDSLVGPVRERVDVLRGVGITLVPLYQDAGSL